MNPETSHILPPLPQSWSELSWQQLCDVWNVKMRYGGNSGVAGAAALLTLTLGGRYSVLDSKPDGETGESVYTLQGEDGQLWSITPRELAHMAKAMKWLDYPYGDPGEKEERDDSGKVIKEKREGHQGYVNPVGEWRDALALPVTTAEVGGIIFSLPQVALVNLTWQQYRSLQGLSPQLFSEGLAESEAADLQAQFLAHAMVPARQVAPTADRFEPKYDFTYNADRAEQTVGFWREQVTGGSPLFHICFQVYQTAMGYYSVIYYDLFGGSGKQDPLHTALSGEVGTLNAVMKYAGYGSPQEVYDANLPIIFDILNTMAKEAKEVEKMNARIRRK